MFAKITKPCVNRAFEFYAGWLLCQQNVQVSDTTTAGNGTAASYLLLLIFRF